MKTIENARFAEQPRYTWLNGDRVHQHRLVTVIEEGARHE